MPSNSSRCGCLLSLVRVWLLLSLVCVGLSPLSRAVSSLSCVCGGLLVRVWSFPLSRACAVFSSISCVCGCKKLFLSFFYCVLFLVLLSSFSKCTQKREESDNCLHERRLATHHERENDPSDTPHLAKLTIQMTLPTENGHAAPPVESRKSYQSDNSYCVKTW